MKNIWLLGNGFNLSVAEYVSDDTVADQIKQLSKLWNLFDVSLGNFAKEQNMTLEEALSMVFTSIDFALSVNTLVSDSSLDSDVFNECADSMKDVVAAHVQKVLMDAIDNFIYLETSGFYSDLQRSRGEFPDQWQYMLRSNDITIFTTNYDGIADTYFSLGPGGMSWIMRDFFRGCDYTNGVCFKRTAFIDGMSRNFRNHLLHLHGSYKFWTNRRIYKYKPNMFEEYINSESKENAFFNLGEPTIIFGPPSSKITLINSNPLLQAQYFALEYLLGMNYTTGVQEDIDIHLVIWGTRLINDPHLRDAITNSERKESTIVTIVHPDNNALTDIGINAYKSVRHINPSREQHGTITNMINTILNLE